MWKLQRPEELVEFLLGKIDSALEERVLNVTDVDFKLFVEFQDVVHKNLLSSAKACHGIGRNQSCQLESKVTFTPSFGLCLNWFKHVVVHALDKVVVHFSESFDDIVGNAVDIVFLQNSHVFDERLDSFARRE